MKNLKREQAYHRLREAITQGEIKPGERVVEKVISERFHFGRTPLREALRLLEMEEYIDVIPNRGAFVRKISFQELEQFYPILAVLEGYAVERSTKLNDKPLNENLRLIEKDLVNAAKANDYSLWMAKNALFHGYFLEMAGNPLLSSQVNSLRRRTHRFQVLAVSITGHLQEFLADHTKILEAVSERKAEKAGRRMRRHIERTGEILVNFLKENPWS